MSQIPLILKLRHFGRTMSQITIHARATPSFLCQMVWLSSVCDSFTSQAVLSDAGLTLAYHKP